MNKLEFLNTCKEFLPRIVKHRRRMFANNRSKLMATDKIVRTMASVEYTVPRIESFDQMMRYIGKQQTQHEIRQLIPANNIKWRAHFDWLVIEGQRLQGIPVRHRNEINFEPETIS